MRTKLCLALVVMCSCGVRVAADSKVSMFNVVSQQAVSDAEMRAIYEEVKTPNKRGMVLRPAKGEMLDNPMVFRHGDAWYMKHIRYDGKGY